MGKSTGTDIDTETKPKRWIDRIEGRVTLVASLCAILAFAGVSVREEPPEPVTRLTVTPTNVTAPVNLVPALKVTIARSNQDLANATLKVDDATCETGIDVEADKEATVQCDLDVDALTPGTPVKVSLTAADATSEAKTVTVDLTPARCGPVQSMADSSALLTKSDFLERWAAAAADEGLTDCAPQASDQSWQLDKSRQQAVGSSSVTIDQSTKGELTRFELRLASSASGDLDHVNAIVSSVFSSSAAEIDALLVDGLQRACSPSARYKLAESVTAGVTTITATACDNDGD